MPQFAGCGWLQAPSAKVEKSKSPVFIENARNRAKSVNISDNVLKLECIFLLITHIDKDQLLAFE